MVQHHAAPFLEQLAQSRVESAYFVVVRRGRTPPLTPPQHGGARFPDARCWSRQRQVVVDVIHDHKCVAVHDRTVIAGTQLCCEFASATSEQRWQFVRVVVDQATSHNRSIRPDQLYRLARGKLAAHVRNASWEQRSIALGERAYCSCIENERAAGIARVPQPQQSGRTPSTRGMEKCAHD